MEVLNQKTKRHKMSTDVQSPSLPTPASDWLPLLRHEQVARLSLKAAQVPRRRRQANTQPLEWFQGWKARLA